MRMIYLPYKYRQHLMVLPLLLIGAWMAYTNIFIQDDAYISYTYAKWFSRGHGLVWHPGSTEFGYTNFLYTFLVGVGMVLRLDPVIASNLINFTSFIGCLVLAYTMTWRLTGSRKVALFPVLLLATDHTFTSYATGGLETMWVTFLVMLFYWQILTRMERPDLKQYQILGVITAVALLSRLDTLLLLIPGYVFTFLEAQQTKRSFTQVALFMKDAFTIPLVALVALLLCCYLAYGHALPTSFDLKIPGDGGMAELGLRYLKLYNMLHIYLPFLVPVLLLYFCARRDVLVRIGNFSLMLGSVVRLWLCYVVFVGGDFMEFRLLVPIMAFYYILIFRIVLRLMDRHRLIVMLIITGGFLVGNILHPALFRTTPNGLDFNNVPKKFDYAFVESSDSLSEWLTVNKVNWIVIGQSLHRMFYTGALSDVKIGVANAGAVSYFSQLPSFDVLGLNSRAVVKNYVRSPINRPGHRLFATDNLLTSEKVVLNLAFPHAVCKQGRQWMFSPNPVTSFPFARHETLFLPLDNGCYAVADYITPHPKVDELISQKTIIRYRDVAEHSDCPPWLCLR